MTERVERVGNWFVYLFFCVAPLPVQLIKHKVENVVRDEISYEDALSLMAADGFSLFFFVSKKVITAYLVFSSNGFAYLSAMTNDMVGFWRRAYNIVALVAIHNKCI